MKSSMLEVWQAEAGKFIRQQTHARSDCSDRSSPLRSRTHSQDRFTAVNASMTARPSAPLIRPELTRLNSVAAPSLNIDDNVSNVDMITERASKMSKVSDFDLTAKSTAANSKPKVPEVAPLPGVKPTETKDAKPSADSIFKPPVGKPLE